MRSIILISACMAGLKTRYDGQTKTNQGILNFLKHKNLTPIPICPEQLSGLSTPRPAVCFERGDGRDILEGRGEMLNTAGQKMNEIFICGARESLKIAELSGCRLALLKERSPSCGIHEIYLRDKVVPGCGVTSALFLKHGIKVFSEKEIDRLILEGLD